MSTTTFKNLCIVRKALNFVVRGTPRTLEAVGSIGCSRLSIIQGTSIICKQRIHSARHVKSSQTSSSSPSFRLYQRRGYASDYPSHTVVNMPALSPTMTMGNLGKWQKKVGDQISAGDVLVEIETDKAQMDFECQDEGFLAKIFIESGEKDVLVNKPIAILVENKADVEKFNDYQLSEEGGSGSGSEKLTQPPTSPPSSLPFKDQESEKKAKQDHAHINQQQQEQEEEKKISSSSSSDPHRVNDRVLASPAAKVIAATKGIPLENLVGTGPGGRILKSDVESYVPTTTTGAQIQKSSSTTTKTVQSTATSASSGISTYVDIPLSNVRKVIASRLQQSKQIIPHYYETIECRLDKVLKLREELNSGADGKFKLSINDFVIKAASLALKDVPDVNSTWHDSFIRRFTSADIAVAVATDSGLITPIIQSVESKGLGTISNTMKELASRARSNKLQPNEYQGGTFTISNLGMYGIHHFTAIINPPHSAILAVGNIDKKLILDDDSDKGFSVVTVMNVTMSADHRVIDGAVTAQWLQRFKTYIENPITMLL